MKAKLSLRNRSIAVIIISALLLVAIPVTAVFAASLGPNYPTVAAGSGWTSPGSISADDTSYATYTISASGTSTSINGTNYGFSIPTGATIDGITVEISRASSSNGGGFSINDSVVQLLKAGTAEGNNKATAADWPTSQGTATYGGTADLWGTTWTAADINNANFGVTLSGVNQSSGSSRIASVDFMRITVNYTVPSTGATNPGSGTDASGVGTITWSNPGFVAADDTNYATAAVTAGAATHYLQATNYGFNIPSGSTILGIQAAIGRFNTGGTGNDIRDNVVSLIKSGSVTGENKAAAATDWPTSQGTATYGSISDLWGTTWDPADINNANFGIALATTNAHPTTTKTASVDFMQITVYYALPATTTLVDCVQNTITFGETSICSVTVTRGAGTNTPAGPVSLISDAGGNFTTCTLSDNGDGSASCSSTYTPSAVGDGSHLITATYVGNSNFQGSNTSQTVTVNKISTSLSITNSPVTYNASSQAATVTGSVSGTISDIKYISGITTFTTPRTDAGTYAVTADFVPTDPNYASLSDAPAGNFVISKANADCSSITGYNVVYDSTAHSALGACVGVGADGALTGLYLVDTTHTNVGVYNNDSWDFFDVSGNYNDASGTVNSTITKANPNCSISGYNITYDASPHSASGSCQGVGGEGPLAGLSLGATTHTNAGTYNNNTWFFSDVTGNYLDDGGTVNSVIAKAAPNCTITPYNVTYDNLSHTSTGSCQGVGGDGALAGLFLGDTTETNAGDYNSPWTFFDVTGNYNDANGTVNNIIAKANATINITPYNVTYDGNSHISTGTATGINSENLSALLDLDDTAHTNAGTYNGDPWTFAGNTNYNVANGTINNNIAKANATIEVTSYDVTYDGNSHASTGTATGVNSEDLSAGLDLSATVHTNAGDYTGDAWTFTDAAGNYNDANGIVDNNIAKANASINITPYDETYDSTPHTATGTATGVNSEDLSSLLNLSSTTHTNVGAYNNDPWSFAGNTNYNSANGTVDNNIAKTDANCSSITGYSITYDSNAHTASGSCQGVGSDGTLSGLDLSATTHTNAGTYNGDAWTFTNPNYNDQNGTVNSSIAKANADCSSITGYSVTYDASAHSASGSCQGVGSDGTLSGLDLSATTHTNAGTYNGDAWTFTNPNYNDQNGTVNSSIAKANPNCSITGYSVTYDTNAHTATGSCQGVGSDGTLSGLDLNATTHTNAGTYNSDAWTFTSSNSNYNSINGTVNNSIAKANTTCTVTGYTVTHDGLPHTATGSCQGVGSDGTLSVLDLSATTHTDVGDYNNDPWTFTDASGNYNNANGTVNNIITFNQVPSLTASGGPFTYDGAAHAATIDSSTPGTVSDVKYNGSSTIPTDAGTYNVTADFLPDDTVNYISLDNAAAGSITINKAAANCTITGYNVAYDGQPHTASGSCVGVGSDGTLSGLNLSATTHTNAGTYNGYAWTFTSGNPNYNNANGTVNNTITKVTLTVTANNQTALSGNPDPAFTFGYSGFVNSETSAVIDTQPTCTVSGAHSAPGSYPIVCSGGADNNYSFSYVNGTLTVNAANNPPTDITLSHSSINESQAVGTVIGTFSTTDPDLGDTFTYSFCGGTDDTSFSISGNSLQSAAIFDFETKESYSVCIRSTDSSALNTTKTFVIAINNLADTQTFEDVPTSYWAWSFIERLYNAGITGGCTTSPLNYCPTNAVTRAQMAIFLLKGIHGSSYLPPSVGPDTGFTDVPTDYWAASWIKQLAAEAITGGCGVGIYCPESTVTRAQMAVFLLKATHGSSYIPPAATGIFTDVPTDYWAVAWIEQLAAEGITGGCGIGVYCPDNPVTRDQMAVFLVKAFGLP